MSICCSFHSLQDAHIDRILDTPDLIWAWITPEDYPGDTEALLDTSSRGFWDRLWRRREPETEPIRAQPLVMAVGENEICDIDKAWHGLHDCLQHLDSQLDFILKGGHELSAVDAGYGPPRLFRCEENAVIYEKLSCIQSLDSSYDPERLQRHDIYPEIWGHEAAQGQLYLQEALKKVRQFLKHCHHHHLGFFICFS